MTVDDARHEWTRHAAWWLDEIRDDPIYRLDVLPLADRLLAAASGVLLDLGCGEGQVMAQRAEVTVGCDISMDLLRLASGPAVCAQLPDLSWLRSDSIDAGYMILVLEHLSNLDIFGAAARVVRRGGLLVVVMNHPAFTSEAAGPIVDSVDGELLWRWGDYFRATRIPMATPHAEVTFYHRPLGDILNAAANAGWCLDEFVEAGFSDAAVATEPGYEGQQQIPRLLGVRWMNTQGSCRGGR